MFNRKTIKTRSKRGIESGNGLSSLREFVRYDKPLRYFLVAATVVLGMSVSQQSHAQVVTVVPDSFDVTIPSVSNNSATGDFTFTCSGTPQTCSAPIFPNPIVDDVFLESITFGVSPNATTYSAASGQIIAGMAAVLTAGNGGGDVNAEWGDSDDASDGNDQPFAKAGYGAQLELDSTFQESTDANVINDTILWVFRNYSLSEGVDGETDDYEIEIEFEGNVSDDDPNPDSRPEILVFERGLNSAVKVTLLLLDGTTSDPLTLAAGDFEDSGIDLNTVEIGSVQDLGVIGVDINSFTGVDPATDTVIGVRVGSAGNGADIFGVYGLSQNPGVDFDFGDAPDSYATNKTDGGEGIGPEHQHSIDLFLGRNPPDAEDDGQPSVDAAADGVDETETLTFPTGSFSAGDTFAVEAKIFNQLAGDALICGWIDFNDDGDFDNAQFETGTTTTNAEQMCATAPSGSVSTGSNPDTVTLNFKIPDDFTQSPAAGGYYARFRITSDWPDASVATPKGIVNDGEVEDYLIDTSTLPVSIASFESRYTRDGLELTWATVSETHNLGFHVWGDRGNGMEQLNAELIPAEDGDPVTPRAYKIVLPGLVEGDVLDLAVTAVDYRGDEEIYGLFEAGARYGQEATPAPIPWQEVRAQASVRGQLRAAEHRRTGGDPAGQQPDYVDLRVTEPGLQEISWQMLADAGLDLAGVAAEKIAVTLKGQPVSRHIVGVEPIRGQSAFGSGAAIRFWGVAPTYPDALYVESYIYRIEIAPSLVRQAESLAEQWVGFADSFEVNGTASTAPGSYIAWQRQNKDLRYHFVTPLADPWFAEVLLDLRRNVYETTFEIDDQLLSDRSARLIVTVGGLSDFEVAPDHHVTVEVNGQLIGETMFDGHVAHTLDLEVPANVLVPGENTVRVNAPGGTTAPGDNFVIDTVELGYPRVLTAIGDRILVESPENDSTLFARGFTSADTVAYAFDGEMLTTLAPSTSRDGSLLVPTLASNNARYWLSASDRLVTPEIIGANSHQDLLAGSSADFLVIVHPAFLPVSDRERHPLNTYLAQRRSDGWKPRLFDITEIQTQYGHGMPLPEAVRSFLAAADKRYGYEHVLLVGGDSYDYLDRLGHGSISFIPTMYAGTQRIPHTPSDALLTDLDGDGLADKAIGRWPVRTHGDLQAIVTKTLEWSSIDNPESAIWVTDSEDNNGGSFTAQAERMIAPLAEAGWEEAMLDRVFFADVAQRPGASQAESARMDLFDQLEQGRALTGFVGHGSPSMWTFQGLLTPDDIKDLYNEGNPTLIGTMTCYTSYFVSPESDTVAHRWMNGYRENAAGGQIPGVANGAVAIHGAATLSNYSQNEFFAREVQELQLAGETLGSAIQAARVEANRRGMRDHVINWTLLGDPTLTLREKK